MCQTVWWNAEPWPEEIESLAQLRSILPAGAAIIGDPGPSGDLNCLCPVDLEATFAAAGLEFARDRDGMGYELKRAPLSEKAENE